MLVIILAFEMTIVSCDMNHTEDKKMKCHCIWSTVNVLLLKVVIMVRFTISGVSLDMARWENVHDY